MADQILGKERVRYSLSFANGLKQDTLRFCDERKVQSLRRLVEFYYYNVSESQRDKMWKEVNQLQWV